jgi:hypothetical protein
VPFISIIIHFLILSQFISLITIFYEFNTQYFTCISFYSLIQIVVHFISIMGY